MVELSVVSYLDAFDSTKGLFMSTIQHSFFVVATASMLLTVASAPAAPPSATQPSNNGVIQPTTAGAAVFKPIDCAVEFDKFTVAAVASFGGVLIGNEAYGTYGTFDSGASQPTTVALVNGKVSGSIVVALPGHAPNNPNAPQEAKGVGIELSKNVANKIIFSWTVDNKTYHAVVATCTAHLWTASAGASAIMLRTAN